MTHICLCDILLVRCGISNTSYNVLWLKQSWETLREDKIYMFSLSFIVSQIMEKADKNRKTFYLTVYRQISHFLLLEKHRKTNKITLRFSFSSFKWQEVKQSILEMLEPNQITSGN